MFSSSSTISVLEFGLGVEVLTEDYREAGGLDGLEAAIASDQDVLAGDGDGV